MKRAAWESEPPNTQHSLGQLPGLSSRCMPSVVAKVSRSVKGVASITATAVRQGINILNGMIAEEKR
jgi:hypothetical protein